MAYVEYDADGKTISARVKQKTDTLANWNANPLPLLAGEQAFIVGTAGEPINFKIGDGTRVFSELPFWIQYDQGSFVVIPGPGELPTPESDVAYSLVGPGTYTYPGQDDIIVESDEMGILVWGNSEWVLSSVIDIPDNSSKAPDWESIEYDKGDLVVNDGVLWMSLTDDNSEEPIQDSENWKRISTYDLVDYFLGGEDKAASARDVKELNERLQFYDRPDLKYHHFLVDKDKRVFDRLLSEKFDGGRLFPEGFEMYPIDRPDLGAIILVDKDGRYLGDSGQSSGGGSTEKTPINIPFYNPPAQNGFSISAAGADTIIGNYDTLISEYDDIMAQGNLNTNIPPYITKSSIGTASVNDQPIYKYSFAPPSAKYKILLVSGEHAVEKMYIWVLYYFMKELVENWTSHPFLEFLRWNVHIDVLPCRLPYAISNTNVARGTRTTPETAPIPVSWTKSGTTATISFDINDFPDNDILTGNDYFTAVPSSYIVNNSFVGIRTTPDNAGLPSQAYRITGVINGQTITVEAPEGGDTSGTGTMQVWADPNRNMSFEDTTGWGNYSVSDVTQVGDDGIEYGKMTNKGTRPFSLKENRLFIEDIVSSSYDYVLSGHAPGGDNYISYNTKTGFSPNISQMLAESGAFVNTGSHIHDRTNDPTPWTVSVVTVRYGTPMQTPEWGSGLFLAQPEQVTDAMRWMIILIKDALTNIVKK